MSFVDDVEFKKCLTASIRSIVAVAVLVVAVLGLSYAQAADVGLQRNDREIVINAQVQTDFAGTEATALATDIGTVEVRVPGADFLVQGKKQLFRFEDSTVKNVSLKTEDNAGVLRFNLKGVGAQAVSEQLRISRTPGQFIIRVPTTLEPVLNIENSSAEPRIVSIAEETSHIADVATSSVAPETAIQTLSQDASSTEVTIKAPAKAPAKAPDLRAESEIPVFSTAPSEKKAAAMGIERLVITLVVLCVLLGAAIFGLKRWSLRRKQTSTSPTKIQVLTQHYLGPKKSLAIIQVAGEAVLIGITDHNISMLKTLALIDDEVPGVVPRNFDEALNEDLADDLDPIENFALKRLDDVRDVVHTKFSLKGNKKRSFI